MDSSKTNRPIINELQDAINKIYDWSITWQLRLASDKCQNCHISLSRISQPSDYFVSDFKLPIVSIARDLGELIDSQGLIFRAYARTCLEIRNPCLYVYTGNPCLNF